MDNLIDFSSKRKQFAQAKLLMPDSATTAYKVRIGMMDKIDLLSEMVAFQEERTKVGRLTPKLMSEGKILFKALYDCAETPELAILTKSYLNHLEFEIKEYLRTGKI